MGIARGPNVINDGLVFGYDTGYPISDNNTTTRFYQGEPVTNLWDSMLNTQSLRTHTKHYWNGIKWTEDSTYTHPGVNGPKDTYLGLVFKHTSGALNSSWSGNSYGYMLRDIACTNGATMAMSSWVYASSDCDVTAIPASIEGESGGETTISGYPVSYDLNNKGTWQVLAKKANSDGNVRFIPLYPRKDGVTNGSFAGFFMWALPQVAYGDHVVPPIQPGATRSDTASLIDLKRTTSIDVGDVSFDSNAQPTFDGTDDEINLPNDLGYSANSVSVFAWFKINGTPTNNYHIICGTSQLEMSIYHPNATYLRNGIDTTNGRHVSNNGNQTLNDGNYHYYGFTFDGSTKRAYIDGVQVGTQSVTGTLTTSFSSRRVGNYANSYYAHGDIPVYKVYNKVLTPEEVTQNFNAYKNRFNT